MPQNELNLELLIARYVEGRLTESESASLRERLKAGPDAWDQFVAALQLHADLSGAEVAGEFEGAEDRECIRQAIAEPKVIPWFRRQPVRLAVAASLVLAAALLWQRPDAVDGQANDPRVSRTAAARFDHDGLETGDHLGRRSRHLNAGLVELEFPSSQAKVVIEAPAGFRVVDERTLWLQSGRLSAQVRNGMEGLRILTPQTDVLDLGTRFAVDVDAGERTEVHVFDGRVEAGWKNRTNPRSERQLVEANEALRFDPLRRVERRSMRSASFIQPEELNGLAAGWNSGQRRHWLAWRERIVADPDLILFATLESAELARGRELSSIDRLGTRVVQGRWPGKQCLEFTREGDAVRLDAGGDRLWPRITLAAWVRLDRLGAPYQSLYHTDGWSTGKEGQVHWMINRRAGMRLALRGNTLAKGATGSPDGYPDSLTPVLPERGRWVHLATVYDCEAATVRFYVNGRFDNEVRQEVAFPARFGPAQIGNWNRTDRKLSGRIDEVLILGRALNDDQIAAIYRVGNPYRGGMLLATTR